MKVSITSFGVDMDVRNKGIEFEVRDTNDSFLGDCYLTKTGLIWCNGRTTKSNGKQIGWAEFIEYMHGRD